MNQFMQFEKKAFDLGRETLASAITAGILSYLTIGGMQNVIIFSSITGLASSLSAFNKNFILPNITNKYFNAMDNFILSARPFSTGLFAMLGFWGLNMFYGSPFDFQKALISFTFGAVSEATSVYLNQYLLDPILSVKDIKQNQGINGNVKPFQPVVPSNVVNPVAPQPPRINPFPSPPKNFIMPFDPLGLGLF